ncbi:MAG: RrF2 family transcriptional regulator [Victivallales bacterium]|nr:RrF2 family transcriptional regulator [Victivallales bacterium]
MKMSTKGRYGLRLMVSLAEHYGDGPVRVGTVVQEQGITANYVHVLMGTLKAAGLVRSTRGPKGGYELTRKPSAITAFDVVSALEGETIPVDCVAKPGTCLRAEACPTRDVWCQVAGAVDGVLKGLTLRTLAENRPGLNETPNYCI